MFIKKVLPGKCTGVSFVDGIQLIKKLKSNMKGALMSVSDKVLLRKRAIIETVNDELKNIAQVEHSRHRSFDNFVVNLQVGIAATATSQRNHPYEYRPLICQMTDSLLYSKVYSSNSRY